MLYKVDYLIIAEELQLVDLKAVALKYDYLFLPLFLTWSSIQHGRVPMLGEKVAQPTHFQVYWAEEQRDETEGRFQVFIFWSLCRVAMNINYLRHVDVTHKRPIISKIFSGWSWRIIRTSWWSFSKWRPEIDSSSSPLSNFESKKRISHHCQ